MSLYKRIIRQKINIPYRFDLRYSHAIDLKKNATGSFDLLRTAFVFGYMQGIRAERVGKAGDLDERNRKRIVRATCCVK